MATTLQTVDGDEDLDHLHPVLIARLEACAADPRMRGQLAIDSGARTREHQAELFAYWLADPDHHPIAADPDRPLPDAYGVVGCEGSWHMVQPSGWAYAADVATARMAADVYAVWPQVAAENRLVQAVTWSNTLPISPPPPQAAAVTPARDVREWWHVQPPLNEGPLVWTPGDDDMTPEQERKLDRLLEILDDGDGPDQAGRSALRRQLDRIEADASLIGSTKVGLLRIQTRFDGLGNQVRAVLRTVGGTVTDADRRKG